MKACGPLWRRRRARRARSARGFTLLEVLVALAILAIGVLASMRAVGMVTQSVGELRDRQMAEWVAQNRLAELRATNTFPGAGSDEGDADQGRRQFHWHEDIKATPNALFHRIDIHVYGDDRTHALAQLSGFVVKPLR